MPDLDTSQTPEAAAARDSPFSDYQYQMMTEKEWRYKRNRKWGLTPLTALKRRWGDTLAVCANTKCGHLSGASAKVNCTMANCRFAK